MNAAGEPVDEVVGRPRSGKLQLALLHHGCGGGELVLVALDAFAINQVCDVQEHLAALGHPAADFFIQRREHAMHLETDSAGPGLAFPLTGGGFPEVGQVFFAYAFKRQVLFKILATACIYMDLEVHFCFSMETLEVALELALIGANGLAKTLVILEYGAKTEGKYGGMFETISDHPGVVDSGFLIERFGWIVLTDDNGQVTGGIEENLISADTKYGFERNGFPMAG